ncbi:MAG: hypothetical protein ACQERB_12650, partial [Promethearchaeati archaeon]
MIRVDQFDEDRQLKKIAQQLNEYVEDQREIDILSLKYELIECLDTKPHTTQVLYLLSYLTEHCPYYISDREIKTILPYTTSEEEKIRINALIMLGFYVIGAPGLLSSYVEQMTEQLTHP